MKTKITLDIYKNGQNNKKSIYRRGLNFELSFSACVYGDWGVCYTFWWMAAITKTKTNAETNKNRTKTLNCKNTTELKINTKF